MAEEAIKEEKKSKQKKISEPKAEMSFLDHLEALRWHIIRSAIALFSFAILSFIYIDEIFEYVILAPKNPDFWTNRMIARVADWVGMQSLRINTHELKVISIEMAGQFMVSIWTSIISGFILASPYVIYQFWSFIKPALYENERKHASGAVFVMSSLFLMGVLFGYYLIVPFSIDFLGGYKISETVENQINILSYISTVTSIVIAGGIAFELPVVAFFLSKIGLLTPRFLRKFRRHSYVVLLIVAAIITPPDVLSQMLVAIPLVFLYEASIFISARVEKANIKKLEQI